jgi:putative endonuclease
MDERLYYVYILASQTRCTYIGVTNKLLRRIQEHRDGQTEGFTSRYRIYRLVYYEAFHDVRTAIAREKEMKGSRLAQKVALIGGTLVVPGKI